MSLSLSQLKTIDPKQYKIVDTYGEPKSWGEVRRFLLATRHGDNDVVDLELKKIANLVLAIREQFPKERNQLVLEASTDAREVSEYKRCLSHYSNQKFSKICCWDVGVMGKFHDLIKCDDFITDLILPLYECEVTSIPFLKAYRHLFTIMPGLPEGFQKRLQYILSEEENLKASYTNLTAGAIYEILFDLLDHLIESMERQKQLWKNLKKSTLEGDRVFLQAGNNHLYQRKHDKKPSEWILYLERKLEKKVVPTVVIKTAKTRDCPELKQQRIEDEAKRQKMESEWRARIEQEFPGSLKTS